MRQLVVTPLADQDVDECVAYIAQDSIDAAVEVLLTIRRSFEFLRHNPHAGTKQPLENEPLLRRWTIPAYRNYLVFYVDDGHSITILRVLHGARDVIRELRNPPDK